MTNVIERLHKMDTNSVKKWVFKNMHKNEELSIEINDMIANVDALKEEAKTDDTIYIDEVEQGYDWSLRYFFLMLKGFDEEDARDYAEIR